MHEEIIVNIQAGSRVGATAGGYVGQGILATFALATIVTMGTNPIIGAVMLTGIASSVVAGLPSVVKGTGVVAGTLVGGVVGLGYGVGSGVYGFFARPVAKAENLEPVEVVVIPTSLV